MNRSIISVNLAVFLSQFAMANLSSQGVTQEVWYGMRGDQLENMISNERFKKNQPNTARILNRIDSEDLGDQYGSRYTALITPPKTGKYIFKLAADDLASVFLSPDNQANNLQKIIELNHYTAPRRFTDKGASKPIELEGGKQYYLQILHKESSGGDHVSLAWETAGMPLAIIDKQYLTPVYSPELKKILEKTAETEKRQLELLSELNRQSPKDIQGWLLSLSPQDDNLLAVKLKESAKSLHQIPLEERRQFLHDYAQKASQIQANEQSPLKNATAKQLLHLESQWLHSLSQDELVKYGPHRLAPSLGLIPENIQPENVATNITSLPRKQGNELVSTGTYALPGVPFTIHVPEELVKQGIGIQIGHHIAPNEKNDLVSMPNTTFHHKIDKETQTFVSPHGGIILFDIPQASHVDQAKISIDQVIKCPRFILEETSDLEWESIRENPAPWGEMVSKHLTMILPREVMKACDNPTEVMAWWNENNRRHEDFYGYYPQKAFRMHTALYAREGISYWPLEWQKQNAPGLLDINHLRKHNNALYLHEHGHHTDFGDMEFGFSSESTCNWAGYYMKSQIPFDWKDDPNIHLVKLLDPNNAQHNEIKEIDWYKISSKGTHHWSYPITSMILGITEDFGWEPLKKTIHRLRDRQDSMYQWEFTGNKTDDQAKIDRYIIGLSEETKRDIRPYFAHFQMKPSEGANAYLDQLKLAPWDLTHLPRPTVTSVAVNQSLTIPQKDTALMSMAPNSSIKWEQPKHGTVTQSNNGDVIYQPKENYVGYDQIPYTVTNDVGSSPVKYISITVVPKKP